MKQFPALDQNALWSSTISSVSAPDDATVVFALKQPNNTALYRIGGQTFIVPEHAWQNIGDPSKFTNDTPVVTGPYLLASHNSQLITYKKNPSYWGTKPAMDEIQVPSIIDNSHAVLEMAKGDLDWLGSGWDPSVDASFTGRDPQHNHTWFSPSNTVMLYMNLQKWPFNQLAVRQAISTAINRPQMVVGPASYAKPANPSGVLTPTYQRWIDPQYAGQNFIFDANQAQNLLKQAGFAKGSDGFYADKSGRKLAFTLTVVNSWNDWVSDTQFIQKDLQAIGINATINAVGGYEPYINALKSGKYDAAVSWTDAGPTPYYSLNDMLYSGDSAQPGQNVTGSNFERWSDPATDTFLKQYATTTDQNTQKQAIAGLEKIVAQQLPTIPLTQNPYWDEYTTKNFTGWPDAATRSPSALPTRRQIMRWSFSTSIQSDSTPRSSIARTRTMDEHNPII